MWHNAKKIIEDEAYKSLHWSARHYVEDFLTYYQTDIEREFVWNAAMDYFKQK